MPSRPHAAVPHGVPAPFAAAHATVAPSHPSSATRRKPSRSTSGRTTCAAHATRTHAATRAQAVNAVNSTIAELGGIFQQLAEVVSAQGAMLQRVDENLDDSLINVREGHARSRDLGQEAALAFVSANIGSAAQMGEYLRVVQVRACA